MEAKVWFFGKGFFFFSRVVVCSEAFYFLILFFGLFFFLVLRQKKPLLSYDGRLNGSWIFMYQRRNAFSSFGLT